MSEEHADAVSRETASLLQLYADELTRWQKAINLVSPNTIRDVWSRHIDDASQLTDLSPGQRWVDLGSGAGLPGLILAILKPEIEMTLIESDVRKCAFLRHVQARLPRPGLRVAEGRISEILPTLEHPDVIVARGLTSLSGLLALARVPLARGSTGLFPKGQRWSTELTQAQASWTFTADPLPSRTNSESRIIRVTEFRGPRAPHDDL